MDPMEFMQRLAALVPRPRLHLIRFYQDGSQPEKPGDATGAGKGDRPAAAASDTLVILEKGCLKFLYPDTPEFLRPHQQPHADAHLRRANYRDVLVARLAIFHRTSPCDADFAIARYVSYRELFRASPEP